MQRLRIVPVRGHAQRGAEVFEVEADPLGPEGDLVRVPLTPASETPSSRMSGFDSAIICFINFSASMAGSLVKSNSPSGGYTLTLMLWVMGANERQPCASNVAPQGATLESTIFFAPARNSSQVAGAASGRPALAVNPECPSAPRKGNGRKAFSPDFGGLRPSD